MNTTGKLVTETFPISNEILEQDQDFFPHPWKAEQWQGLVPEQNLVFSWKENQKLIGWALFSLLNQDDTAHLYKILVHPSYRGSGKALSFWEAILAELRKTSATQVYLEVEASNLVAQKFYEKCGFKLLRRVKSYYSNGDDGLIMLLTLKVTAV